MFTSTNTQLTRPNSSAFQKPGARMAPRKAGFQRHRSKRKRG
jgi:hypothetical protein